MAEHAAWEKPILRMSRRSVSWMGGIATAVFAAITLLVLVRPFPGWFQIAVVATFVWGTGKYFWQLMHPPVLIQRTPSHDGTFMLRGLNTLGKFHKTIVDSSDEVVVGESEPYGRHLEALGGGRPLAAISRRLGIYVTPVQVGERRKYFLVGDGDDVTPARVRAAVAEARRH